MEDIGQRFMLGVWAVSQEKTSEFIEAWQSSSNWLAQHLPDERGAVLLADATDPAKFISFAPIADPAKTEEVMSDPEFQRLFSAVMEICDHVDRHRMQVVGAAKGEVDI